MHLPSIVYLVLPEAKSSGSVSLPHPHLVGQNIDTFIGNARITGDFPEALAERLEDLKRQSQEAEEDLPRAWRFAGEVLFIKPHGAGKQWRWILHSPSDPAKRAHAC